MDVDTLAKVCIENGAIDAVCLDGGRSSNMAWRLKNQPDVIWSAVSTKLTSYPIGNLLAIIKE